MLFGSRILSSDPGLHGGGWHIHGSGGFLNTHLDYSLHPKLLMQRKINVIVYLNRNWCSQWGGAIGFWGNESSQIPGELVRKVSPYFNRAVIFDTTSNSWHGLPEPIQSPEGEFRKSLAVYYLVASTENVNPRERALFAPSKHQVGDADVEELIRIRADKNLYAKAYKK